MRPGDWICVSCSNHNFARRTTCNRCGTAQSSADFNDGSGAGGPSSQQSGWPSSYGGAHGGAPGGMGASMNSGYGNDFGGAGNYQPPSAPDQQFEGSSHFGGGQGGYGGSHGGSQREGRPGDWECAKCNNFNFSRRDSCNRCQAPRTVKPWGDNQQPDERNGGNGGGYFNDNNGSLPTGGSNMDPNMRPGDWLCPRCNNHNFAKRTECNRCSEQKPEAYSQHQTPQYSGGGEVGHSYGGSRW